MYFSPGGNNQFIILKIFVALKIKGKDILVKLISEYIETPSNHLKTSEEICTESRPWEAYKSPSWIVLTVSTLSTRKKNW